MVALRGIPGGAVTNDLQPDIRVVADHFANQTSGPQFGKVDLNHFVENQCCKMLLRHLAKLLLQLRSIYTFQDYGDFLFVTRDDDGLTIANLRDYTAQHDGICTCHYEKQEQNGQIEFKSIHVL